MTALVCHKEIAVLDFRVTLGVQRRPDGRKAGVGDGARREAGAVVGVVGVPDVGRDAVPPAVIGGHPVPQIVVVGIALDMAGGVALQLGVGRTLRQPVAEHLGHIIVLVVARFLLHERCQRDQLRQGHPLLVQLLVHGVGDLLVKVGVERGHIMVDGVVFQKLVGIREEIALALQKAVRGVLVVRDILPELIFTEIAGVGLFQEFLSRAEAGILHLPGHGDGGGTLGERQADALGLGILRQHLDQVVVGAAGCKRKLAVLQFCGSSLFAHIPAEQAREFDHPRLFQRVGNGAHAAALLDAHGDFLARRAAVDLPLCHPDTAARDHEQQYQQHQNYFQCPALFAGSTVGIFVCHTHSFNRFPASAACSSRSHQRVRPQSGSCHSPAGCPRPGTGSGQHPP